MQPDDWPMRGGTGENASTMTRTLALGGFGGEPSTFLGRLAIQEAPIKLTTEMRDMV